MLNEEVRMRLSILISLLLFHASSVAMDDSERNPIAKKLKHSVMKKVTKAHDVEGFCDLFITMKHKGKTAVVKSVRTNGNHQLCKLSKSGIKIGRKFRYDSPANLIRLHIRP